MPPAAGGPVSLHQGFNNDFVKRLAATASQVAAHTICYQHSSLLAPPVTVTMSVLFVSPIAQTAVRTSPQGRIKCLFSDLTTPSYEKNVSKLQPSARK